MFNLNQIIMKRIVTSIILVLTLFFIGVILSGCGETETDKFDRFMTELDCPIILIGKTDKAVNYPAIVVRDASGRIRTFSYTPGHDSSEMPEAIADSREIGDTLKPCN